MLKENEGHGFRNQENQFEFYEATERLSEAFEGLVISPTQYEKPRGIKFIGIFHICSG